MSYRRKGRNCQSDLLAVLRAAIANQTDLPSDLRRERILRPGEAAAYIGLGTKMLWFMRRHGIGPAYYEVGDTHAVGYRVSDLDRWLEFRRVPAVSKTA